MVSPYVQQEELTVVDVQARLGPKTEGRFAFAQRSPTIVGSVCRDNLPSVRRV